MSSNRYIGTELDLFAHASNWKGYLRRSLSSHLRGNVLEVGGGIGATTAAFRSAAQNHWTVLEPDLALASRLRARIGPSSPPVHVIAGTLAATCEEPAFDTILYIDVLEHIEDDRGELRKAAARLVAGGVVVVLSPAHQSLYTAFDSAIGHYRRYNKQTLRGLTPAGTRLVEIRYLDSTGLALSVANKLLLKSAAPTLAQIRLWDRWFVPVSTQIDRLTAGHVGKSVLAVWRRDPAA